MYAWTVTCAPPGHRPLRARYPIVVKEAVISRPRPPAAGTVAGLGEFALIERITGRLAARAPAAAGVLPVGPGDDAAVVAAPDGRVVATTDLLVDGVHFDRGFSSGADVGVRAAAANLADVAAMGAAPTALLVGLAAPPELPLDFVDGLADGLGTEAAAAGVAVAGGDIVRCDRLVVAVTALGDLGGRGAVRRAGARPGDVVVVAGRLGWAAAGLALLRAGRGEERRFAPLARAHRRPTVAYGAGPVLAGCGATAMIDVSDGLAADLAHVAAASGVRIELASSDLPVGPELRAAGRALRTDPLAWVAGGGDDHAFAATMPTDAALRAAATLAREQVRCPFVQVGRVTGGRAGVTWVDREPPGAAGHAHFADGGVGAG